MQKGTLSIILKNGGQDCIPNITQASACELLRKRILGFDGHLVESAHYLPPAIPLIIIR